MGLTRNGAGSGAGLLGVALVAVAASALVALPVAGAQAFDGLSALSALPAQPALPLAPGPVDRLPPIPVAPGLPHGVDLAGVAVVPSVCVPPDEVFCTPGSVSTGNLPLEVDAPDPVGGRPAQDPVPEETGAHSPPLSEDEVPLEQGPVTVSEEDALAAAEEPSPLPGQAAQDAPAGPSSPPRADGAVDGPRTGPSPILAGFAIALPWAFVAKLLSVLALRRRRRDSQWRAKVLALVQAHPGIRHTSLVRLVGNGNGTVEHHVGNLIADGQVCRVHCLRSTSYYPAGHPALARAQMVASLHGGTSRRMAQVLAERPGLRLGVLAKAVGVSNATAHYQLRKLEAGSIVARAGGEGGFVVTPKGLECLRGMPEPAAGSAVA